MHDQSSKLVTKVSECNKITPWHIPPPPPPPLDQTIHWSISLRMKSAFWAATRLGGLVLSRLCSSWSCSSLVTTGTSRGNSLWLGLFILIGFPLLVITSHSHQHLGSTALLVRVATDYGAGCLQTRWQHLLQTQKCCLQVWISENAGSSTLWCTLCSSVSKSAVEAALSTFSIH